MVGWIGSVRGVSGLAAIGVIVAACGGQSRSVEKDEPGAGATGSGASGGAGGSGGNVGGSGGAGGSGGTASHNGCTFNGVEYELGASFPAGDSCNTCTCQGSEGVVCTRKFCMTCESVATAWDDAMLEARRCTPGLDTQCTELVSNGLACGCPTFVNSDAPVTSLQGPWATLDCGEGIVCGACPAAPVRGECSTEGLTEGLCVDVFGGPLGTACNFAYLGDWILCEGSGSPNSVQVVGATELEDCMELCRVTPGCTAVTDYFWLDRPDLGCWMHLSGCDSPGPTAWAEEDGGRQYRKVCEP